jgi:hypothetical protein
MSVHYQIHPSIGIARIGNSRGPEKNDYFLGPEYGFESDFPPKSRFRDTAGCILRQAARFRVFRIELDEDGEARASEVNLRDVRRIVWTVKLANRKAVGRRLEAESGPGKYRNNTPNPEDLDATEHLIIAPEAGELYHDGNFANSAKSRRRKHPIRHVFTGGKFKGKEVALGDMEVDDAGRLIVRGGWGDSWHVGRDETRKLRFFAENDDWCDDTSDGKVSARIELLEGGESIEAEPAWVLVGPPDFAPEIRNLITLYDVARQIAINKGLRRAPSKPDFTRDIKPLLERVFAYQWVNKYASVRHGRGRPYDFDTLEFWGPLKDPAGDPGLRHRLFDRLRDPNSEHVKSSPTDMPRLHDDLGHFGEYDEKRVLAFLPFQFGMLKQWCEGDFFGPDRPDPGPIPSEPLTDSIDRVSMEGCVGAPFYPGIETWDIIRDESLWAGTSIDPFRLNYRNQRLKPGRLTEGNALPWQADFLDCAWEDNAGWWPAERPDHVRIDPDSDEMVDWAFGLSAKPGKIVKAEDMVKNWDKLGFVVKSNDSQGRECFIEVDRDPNHVLARRPDVAAP